MLRMTLISLTAARTAQGGRRS